MLTIEQYGKAYLQMMAVNGDLEQEQHICRSHGFTAAQWHEAQAHYTAQMMNPADGGKTAMAFSAAMTQPVPPPVMPPASFMATAVHVWINEYDVQMILWEQEDTGRFLEIQKAFTSDEQEWKYGMDTWHISINAQEYSIYGGLKKVLLERDQATFFFDEAGAGRMQCTALTATFRIDGKMYNYLCRKMKFVFGDLLDIIAPPRPEIFEVNGFTLADEWQYFETPTHEVNIRPRLYNLKDSRQFPFVVYIDFQSTTLGTDAAELALVDELGDSLRDILEHDLTSVIAFDTTSREGRRYYIYTGLNQDIFMQRANEALRLLPQLPLVFNGGDDEDWSNYQQCLADMHQYKNA